MSSNQSFDRFRRAKSEVTHNRTSMDSLKSEFRSKFINKLRSARSRSVDRFRQIVEGYGDDIHYKSVQDLRTVLLKDKEATSLMNTDEVNDLVNQIEQELAMVFLEKEAEEHLKVHQVETDDIVNRHLVCVVCNKLSEDGNICEACSAVLRTEFD